MSGLVKYDAACRAIAAAKSLSDIKCIRDKSEAMRAYAKVIRNRKLEIDAAEIRLRAERRLGELIQLQKATVGLNPGARGNPGGRGAKIVPFPPGSAQPRLADVGIDHKLSSRAQRLANVTDNEFEGRLVAWRRKAESEGERISVQFLNGTAYAKASFSGEDEWYTPPLFAALVRDFLGGIDLDPASCVKAQRIVQAKRFYTRAENGLTKRWSGNVFINPPYSRDLMPQFAEKLVTEFRKGNVTEAICLTHNFSDTQWFHRLSKACSAICFTEGRIRFLDPKNNEASPTQGQAFTYFGKRVSAFKKHFSPIGLVVVPA